MNTLHYGAYWDEPVRYTPAVVTLREHVKPQVKIMLKMKWPYWVIDYSHESNLEYYLPDFNARWEKRLNNTLHIYAPFTEYHERLIINSGFSHSAAIVFSGGETLGLERFIEPTRGFAEIVDPEGKLGQIICNGAKLVNENVENGRFQAQSVLFHLIAELNCCNKIGSIFTYRKSIENETFYKNVDTYLQKNLHRKLTRRDIARHFCASISTLSHRYRNETGRGVMQRLMELRIARVKSMLLNGYQLQHIAETTGFCDAYHLSKAFKKKEETSPRFYRMLFQEPTI